MVGAEPAGAQVMNDQGEAGVRPSKTQLVVPVIFISVITAVEKPWIGWRKL